MEIPRQKIKETKLFLEENQTPKMIHYRELYKEITFYNFHISTKVDFKRVTEKEWKDVSNVINKLKFTHTSESGSSYMVTDDGLVYRKSNHWGAIASCEWTLEGEGQLICSIFESGPVEWGVAKMENFKVFLRPVLAKKDFRINPEWIDKFRFMKKFVSELFELIADESFERRPAQQKALIGHHYGMFKGFIKDIKF